MARLDRMDVYLPRRLIRLAKVISGDLQLFPKIVELRLDLLQKLREIEVRLLRFLVLYWRLLQPLPMRSFGPTVAMTGGLRSALWTLLGTPILLMRSLNGFLLGRLNSRQLRKFVAGLSEFRLQDLFQDGRQILLRELFLPA